MKILINSALFIVKIVMLDVKRYTPKKVIMPLSIISNKIRTFQIGQLTLKFTHANTISARQNRILPSLIGSIL